MCEYREGFENQERNGSDCIILTTYTIQKTVRTVLKKGELPPEPKQGEVILTEIEEDKKEDEEDPPKFA